MRAFTVLALLGLIVCYANGRAIVLEDDNSSNSNDNGQYITCVQGCQDTRETCDADCGNEGDAKAAECGIQCTADYDECMTGKSSRDENIPYYKRQVKRNCSQHLQNQNDSAKKDVIDYELLMQQ
jgi:hypothetical protein